MFSYDTLVLALLLSAGCVGMEFLYRGCKEGGSYMRVVGFCIIVVSLKLVLMLPLEKAVEPTNYESVPDVIYTPGGMGIAINKDNHTYGIGIGISGIRE